ncbi:MAG: TIGR03000 domain-containing protein [Planctomycetota bacterium]|nr:TIGR03000 domain-containing protein [Planctomycetota bacterium]
MTSLAGSTAAGQSQGEKSTGRTVANSAVLTAKVPAEARVYVNGVLTATRGTDRRYFSEGLLPGHRYDFRFEVVLERNGQRLSDTQVVHVHAGDSLALDFHLADQRIAQK